MSRTLAAERSPVRRPRSRLEGEGGKPVHNRFDLVPTSDPLGRRWQLQAASANEASDWLMALDAARTLEQGVEPHAGRANVIH